MIVGLPDLIQPDDYLESKFIIANPPIKRHSSESWNPVFLKPAECPRIK